MKQIPNSQELKSLNVKQLNDLAEDIRQNIVEMVTLNGGHLSSNLGVVELTLALHYFFDFKKDKLIFDVGHQSYTHKLLTRELSSCEKLRQKDGISGFPDITESDYDAFGTGHSGTSLPAGIGICLARDRLGEDYTVISVIGDGSLSNGLSLESIFGTDNKPDKFIVVYNDNGHSISKNNTGLYKRLSRITIKRKYTNSKNRLKMMVGGRDSSLGKFLAKCKFKVKKMMHNNIIFDSYGLKYVGPIDGHDIKSLLKVLKDAKSYKKSIFLHIVTTKGKGYEPAEKNSGMYHGIGKNMKLAEHTFSSTVSKILIERAQKDNRIFAITAAMKYATGLADFQKAFPNNFLDVGIAEEYAVTLSAGLAGGGLKPVVCIYSTFLQRAYDEILHDVCIQNLPVIFILDRAGLVGADGKTHQGVFDIAYLRHIPNMHILSPKDKVEFESAFDYALSLNGPVAIRVQNGFVEDFATHTPLTESLWEVVSKGEKVSVLAVGSRAINVALHAKEQSGINFEVVNCRTIKPVDLNYLKNKCHDKIITIEDGILAGGFGSCILETCNLYSLKKQIRRVGVEDKFISHASVNDQLQECGITEKRIIELIKELG